MSMCYTLYAASDETITKLLEAPDLIHEFLQFGASPATAHPGLWNRLFRRSTKPAKSSCEFSTGISPCSLDKSWHGLHYLFSGSDWEGDPPQGFLLNSGVEIGEIDLSYGPARAYLAQECRQFDEFLESLSIDSLQERFDPERMSKYEIYPNCWEHDPLEELNYLSEFLAPLKSFMRAVSHQGLGAVAVLS